jgi:hypothetical protein
VLHAKNCAGGVFFARGLKKYSLSTQKFNLFPKTIVWNAFIHLNKQDPLARGKILNPFWKSKKD